MPHSKTTRALDSNYTKTGYGENAELGNKFQLLSHMEPLLPSIVQNCAFNKSLTLNMGISDLQDVAILALDTNQSKINPFSAGRQAGSLTWPQMFSVWTFPFQGQYDL